MGYTTEFTGRFTFSRPLTAAERAELNGFCDERHHAPGKQNTEADYAPSLYCDWRTDGEGLFWNGAEKSYQMLEWVLVLVERFLKPWGVRLSGEIAAQGEIPSDIWKMKADGFEVKRVRARVVFEDDE